MLENTTTTIVRLESESFKAIKYEPYAFHARCVQFKTTVSYHARPYLWTPHALLASPRPNTNLPGAIFLFKGTVFALSRMAGMPRRLL